MAYNDNNGGYRPYPTYNKPSKSAEIKKFVDDKKKGIADYTSKQEVSITVQSALRDAVLICVNSIDFKDSLKEFPLEKRLEMIDDIAVKMIMFYAEEKPKLSELYENLRRRKVEIEDKELSAEDIEVGNDENGKL